MYKYININININKYKYISSVIRWLYTCVV